MESRDRLNGCNSFQSSGINSPPTKDTAMSVVNEINAHFNGLHRDLKQLASELGNLSAELHNKGIQPLPELSPLAKGLLPSIASRQMDLTKLITHLTSQVQVIRGIVNPPQSPAVSAAKGFTPPDSVLERSAINAVQQALDNNGKHF